MPEWLATAERAWAGPREGDWAGPAAGLESEPPARPRVVVPIWRDPWMVVGARTFAGDVLSRLGLVNVFGTSDQRYPRLELAQLQQAGADLVLLPDEPYLFTADDGPEAFPDVRTVLVSG